jgi:hypothetical protein
MRTWLVIALLVCGAAPASAQVPYIVGTWKLNVAASRLPGPAPQTHVRRYSLADDGTLVGLAVVVDARGTPDFLQFAARSDGRDYPEFNSGLLAEWQTAGKATSREYSESPIDARTVTWTDKRNGQVISHGRKWVSDDGRTLTFTAIVSGQAGQTATYLYVFDRQ